MKAYFYLRIMQHDHPTLCINAWQANFTEESTKISVRSNCVIGKKTFYSFSMLFIALYFITQKINDTINHHFTNQITIQNFDYNEKFLNIFNF